MDDTLEPNEDVKESKNKKADIVLNEKETTFNQKSKMEIPWLWFALILLPVVYAIILSLVPNKEVEETQDEPVILKTSQHCEFERFVGLPAASEVMQFINPTNRPMRTMIDNGYKVPPENENRINIFVNPDRIITRIECG